MEITSIKADLKFLFQKFTEKHTLHLLEEVTGNKILKNKTFKGVNYKRTVRIRPLKLKQWEYIWQNLVKKKLGFWETGFVRMHSHLGEKTQEVKCFQITIEYLNGRERVKFCLPRSKG